MENLVSNDKRVGGKLTAEVVLESRRIRAALVDDPNSEVTAQLTIERQRAHRVRNTAIEYRLNYLHLYQSIAGPCCWLVR